jgi:hypothetical protein
MKSDADLVEASKSWTQRQRERRRREGKCRFCETPSGRPFRLPGASADDWTGKGRCTPDHAYVVPCWCLKGQGFRRGLEKAPKDPERDFTEAGRAKKLTRLGR